MARTTRSKGDGSDLTSRTAEQVQTMDYIRPDRLQQSLRNSQEQGTTKNMEQPQSVLWEYSSWLKFLPRQLGLHVNRYDGKLPTEDAPQLPREPTQPIRPEFQTPVGHATGDCEDSISCDDNGHILTRGGATCFIRLTHQEPGFKWCDSTGQHVNPSKIWFDQDKRGERGMERMLALVKELSDQYQVYYADYVRWGNEMRVWRCTRRIKEVEFWKQQVDAKNWVIFNPAMDVPNRHEDLHAALQMYVLSENKKDEAGEFPNAFTGRPPYRSVELSLEEITAVEREYGAENPPSQLSHDLEAQLERLGLDHKNQPFDRRGARLWEMGARIVRRKQDDKILAWEVSEEVGPRPGAVPENLTVPEELESRLHMDEDWNNQVMAEVSAILGKMGIALEADEVAENEENITALPGKDSK